MFRLRYSTVVLLALGLLSVSLLVGYLLQQSRAPRAPAQVPAELSDRDAASLEHPDRGTPPVLVEVLAAFPGASTEEVERQVTIPLEVALAGVPHLQSLRTHSVFGHCRLRARFSPGSDYSAARQEVINRLQLTQALPPGVFPQIGPRPGGETLRYLVVGPRDALGRPVYSLNDLRTSQEWHLERELRRLPGLADVHSSGGTVKRYEIHLDPDRLHRFGITRQQVVDAVARRNTNVNGDFFAWGPMAINVRSVGLFGGGADPFSAEVLTVDPQKAASLLRASDRLRLRQIRALVVAMDNTKPITVADVVEGGRLTPDEEEGRRGVVVGSQPRREQIAYSGPGTAEEQDVVQGVVLMRANDDPQLLRDVQTHIRGLNTTAGKLLPGVHIEPYSSDSAGVGTLWVYGMFPLNTSLGSTAEQARKVVKLLREFPEVERVVSQAGMTADSEPSSTNHLQIFVGLKAGPGVPAAPGLGRPRSRTELLGEFDRLLSVQIPGVAWLTTTKDPDVLGLAFPGVPAENLLLIVGDDLNELERLASLIQAGLRDIPGIESVAAFPIMGRTSLNFRVDRDKCQRWGVREADVSAALNAAFGGQGVSQMVEGEKTFEIIMAWPKHLSESEIAILDLPLDIYMFEPAGPTRVTPRVRLRDLVSPVGRDGKPDAKGDFMLSGAAAIYRAQGKRVLPVRFGVRGRPLADIQTEAANKIAPLLKMPYQIEWSN